MNNNSSSILYQSIIFFSIISTQGCLLSYVTEPDQQAKKEMAKSFDQVPGCAKNSNKTCHVNNSESKRYKLKERHTISMLNNSDDAIRTQAVTEVAEYGITEDSVIAKINEMAIHDKSKWVRRASVKTLAKTLGREALPTLKLASHDSDPWVRHSAQKAIIKLNN